MSVTSLAVGGTQKVERTAYQNEMMVGRLSAQDNAAGQSFGAVTATSSTTHGATRDAGQRPGLDAASCARGARRVAGIPGQTLGWSRLQRRQQSCRQIARTA